MRKEKVEKIDKVWGCELWIVNSDLYCGKLLCIDEGAQGSYHYHEEKTETFWCMEGQVLLNINGKDYNLTYSASPKTIEPGEPHSIYGVGESVILEVSTPHSEEDVVRLSKSKGAGT